jgi:hypothetical protein
MELFVKTLAEQLARKNVGNYAIVVAFLRTRLSFGILTSVDSVHMSERGWRVPFKKRDASGFFVSMWTQQEYLRPLDILEIINF